MGMANGCRAGGEPAPPLSEEVDEVVVAGGGVGHRRPDARPCFAPRTAPLSATALVFFDRRDFSRAALFLWIYPRPAARSSAAWVVLKPSAIFAASPSLRAAAARLPLRLDELGDDPVLLPPLLRLAEPFPALAVWAWDSTLGSDDKDRRDKPGGSLSLGYTSRRVCPGSCVELQRHRPDLEPDELDRVQPGLLQGLRRPSCSGTCRCSPSAARPGRSRPAWS